MIRAMINGDVINYVTRIIVSFVYTSFNEEITCYCVICLTLILIYMLSITTPSITHVSHVNYK